MRYFVKNNILVLLVLNFSTTVFCAESTVAGSAAAAAASSSSFVVVDNKVRLKAMNVSPYVIDQLLKDDALATWYCQNGADFSSSTQKKCFHALVHDRMDWSGSVDQILQNLQNYHNAAWLAKEQQAGFFSKAYVMLSEYCVPSSHAALPYWLDKGAQGFDPYVISMVRYIGQQPETQNLSRHQHAEIMNQVSRAVAKRHADLDKSYAQQSQAIVDPDDIDDEIGMEESAARRRALSVQQTVDTVVANNNGRLLAKVLYSAIFSPHTKEMLLRVLDRNTLRDTFILVDGSLTSEANIAVIGRDVKDMHRETRAYLNENMSAILAQAQQQREQTIHTDDLCEAHETELSHSQGLVAFRPVNR